MCIYIYTYMHINICICKFICGGLYSFTSTCPQYVEVWFSVFAERSFFARGMFFHLSGINHIYRERQRERETKRERDLYLFSIHIHIYREMHTYLYVYIYIYTNTYSIISNMLHRVFIYNGCIYIYTFYD